MTTQQIDSGERITQLLRELGGMLVERRRGSSNIRPQTGVSLERTAQVAGLQATLMPFLLAPVLILVPPTDPIGGAGWALAIAGNVLVVAMGVALIRARSVSAIGLAWTNITAAGVTGMLAWLTGGFESPYPIVLPLIASSIAPHRPRVRRILIAWIVLVAALPLLYDTPITEWKAALSFTLIGTSIATLITMVWLSTRVGRSEAGLMDAISSAQFAQEALEEEAERLLELSDARDRLVTRVSHELRTPLTSIKGYVEALMEGEAGALDRDQRELAAVALRNTVRLELLIADLLLLSRVEAGQLQLRPAELGVREMLDDLSMDLSQLARDREIKLVVEAPEAMRWVADRERLDQAISNLISNAIKYSPVGSAVLTRARQAGDDLCIEVLDKGVGVPPDEIGRLGERFFRASTAGDAKGTGLGIAITQELVELHGGRLEIESEVGSGSIFRIRIPPHPLPE